MERGGGVLRCGGGALSVRRAGRGPSGGDGICGGCGGCGGEGFVVAVAVVEGQGGQEASTNTFVGCV